MVIHFFAKFILTERKRPSRVIFQSGMVHNQPSKQSQKSMNEKSLPFIVQSSLWSFVSYKMAPPALLG
jgi:hypothetical protein